MRVKEGKGRKDMGRGWKEGEGRIWGEDGRIRRKGKGR